MSERKYIAQERARAMRLAMAMTCVVSRSAKRELFSSIRRVPMPIIREEQRVRFQFPTTIYMMFGDRRA